jgi:hypothetical protein
MASCAVSFEFASSQFIEERFGHDATRRIAGAEEQNVKRLLRHIAY